MTKKKFILILLMALSCVLMVQGCGPEEASEGGSDGDGDADGDTDGDTDTDSDGDADGDSDGDSDGDADGDSDGDSGCELDEYETFDTSIPSGWTVLSSIGGGSGSGSGSASASEDVTEDVDPAQAWHHTTVDDESNPYDGMEEGYMTVGGYTGLNETLETDYYVLDGCEKVTLSFTHYFDDYGAALDKTDDRGELWFVGDSPPWTLIATYDNNDDKEAKEEEVDLSSHIVGQTMFRVKFVFADEGQGNYGWAIDNVSIIAE